MSFEETDTISSSRAVSPNIYRRQVPGISNGQLASAISADQQRQRDEPTINAAFTQTSPSLYYHQQAAANAAAATMGQQQQQQPFPQRPIATWGTSGGSGGVSELDSLPRAFSESVPLSAEQADTLIATQERLDASLDRLENIEQQQQSQRNLQQSIEPLEQQMIALKNSVSTLTWILVALGIVLLTLLVVVLVMVSRAYTIACTNQQQSSNSAPSNTGGAPPPTARVPLASSSADSLFK